MRFIYEDKQIAISDKGQVHFVDKSLSVIEEKLLENCKKFEVNNYKELLNKIRLETSSKTEKYYYIFNSDDYFLFTVSEFHNDPKIIAFYKPENSEIEKTLFSILNIKKDAGKLIVSNNRNNFNFITAFSILELYFIEADLRFRKEKPFRTFKITSKNGKVRDITAPHDDIKPVLRDINGILQTIFDKKNASFQVAYKKGKNIKTNADIHVDKKYVFNMDLKDFYPSCKRELVQRYTNVFFKNAPNSKVIEKKFLDIILDKKTDALFIGNPVSGTLANVIISNPVKYMKNMASKFGMGFSVYADDITFSSDKFIKEEFVNKMFNIAFTNYNLDGYFNLNEGKSHGMSSHRRRITGVSINDKNQTTVSRKFYRDLRVKIHKLSVGENVNIQKLRGKLAFASMVDNSGKIGRLVDKFETTVKQFNLMSEEKLQEIKGGIA